MIFPPVSTVLKLKQGIKRLLLGRMGLRIVLLDGPITKAGREQYYMQPFCFDINTQREGTVLLN